MKEAEPRHPKPGNKKIDTFIGVIFLSIGFVFVGFALQTSNGVSLQTLLISAAIMTATYLSFVDATTHLLPNIVTAPLALAATATVLIVSIGSPNADQLVRAVACGVGLSVVFFVAHILAGLGMGDVKYSYSIGVITGWFGIETLITALMVTSLTGALGAVITTIATKSLRHRTAYGPYLSLGLATALVLAIN